MLQSQVFTASGSFSTPSGRTAAWVTGCGGGAAGEGYSSGTGSTGTPGGAAEFCEMRLIALPLGGSTAVVIGTGGVGRGDRATADPGTLSSYGAYDLFFGYGSPGGGKGGIGGGANGANFNATPGRLGAAESRSYFGGTQGNTFVGGGSGSDSNGNDWGGHGAQGIGTAAHVGSPGGGALWEHAGDGGADNAAGGNASANSGAGGGSAGGQSSTHKGGNGGSGRVEFFWS